MLSIRGEKNIVNKLREPRIARAAWRTRCAKSNMLERHAELPCNSADASGSLMKSHVTPNYPGQKIGVEEYILENRKTDKMEILYS